MGEGAGLWGVTATGHKVSVWVGEEVQQLDCTDGCATLSVLNATKLHVFMWRNR